MPAESFTKLFSSITTSTIWCEPDHVRIAWITMLALADRDGYVGASVPGLAAIARIEVEQAREAIHCFLAPDPDSRTKDHDGRRIEETDRGWQILNYSEFRKRLDAEEARERKRRWWIENRGKDTRQKTSSLDKLDQTSHITEADTDTDTDKAIAKAKSKPQAALPEPPAWVNQDAWQGFVESRRKLRFPLTPRAAKLVITKLEGFKAAGADASAILDQSTRNGWRDVFEIKPEYHNRAGASQPGKVMQAIQALEIRKNERKNRQSGLVIDRTGNRIAEVALLESGQTAGE